MYDLKGHRGTVEQFLTDTSCIDKIEQLRATDDIERQRHIKRQLPQATLSGIFEPKRHTSALVQHSGLICIDIDAKENTDVPRFELLKEEVLAHISEVAYASLSVGGKGYFAIIPIKYPHLHREHFIQIKQDFKTRGITIDSACSDVTRLRCMSYDPNPIVNHDATVYSLFYREPPQRPRQPMPLHNLTDTIYKATSCVNQLLRLHIDITQDYHSWFVVGAALSTLGEPGRALFHAVSSMNPKYTYRETDRMFSNLISKTGKITISSFFYCCSQHGIRP